METNELPEDVKRSIDAEYGDVSDRDYGIETLSSDIADGKIKAAEFGYRLGLQACEEQLKAKDEEIANLKTVMIAAAEEIQEHWQAHCDAEGYGPANLMHRLENGIPSKYGYTAGAFERQDKLIEKFKQLHQAIKVNQDVFPSWMIEPMTEIDSLLTETKPE